jgi:hypothetical protein
LGRASPFRFDGWGTLTRPRDLTMGQYRAGRRPIDLYRRVALGINGGSVSGSMLAFRDTLKGGTEKDPKTGATIQKPDVWDVVNCLQALPYPAMRAKYGLNVD